MKNHNQNSKKKNSKEFSEKERNPSDLIFSHEIKRMVFGSLLIMVAIIIALSFFDKAGAAGGLLKEALAFLFGKKVMSAIPLSLFLFSFIFFKTNYRKFLFPAFLSLLILILGISGIFGTLNIDSKSRPGGFVGFILSWPLARLFGILATRIVFAMVIAISLLVA